MSTKRIVVNKKALAAAGLTERDITRAVNAWKKAPRYSIKYEVLEDLGYNEAKTVALMTFIN